MSTQFTILSNSGVTAFASLAPGNSIFPSAFSGFFQGVNQSAAQTAAIMQPLADNFNSSYGSDIQSHFADIKEYTPYYDRFQTQQGETTTPLGIDLAFASRILDEKTLNHANFTALIKNAAAAGITFNGVAGPGTHAYPGDFNVVTPAWRTGYFYASAFIKSANLKGNYQLMAILVSGLFGRLSIKPLKLQRLRS